METLGTIIKIKTSPGLQQSLTAAMVIARVNTLSDGSWQATQFKKSRLYLAAKTPIDAQELVIRQDELLFQINKLLGDKAVDRLIISTNPNVSSTIIGNTN